MVTLNLAENIKKDFLKPEGFRNNMPSLFLSTVAINMLSLALPIITLQVYDRILPNPGTGTLPVLITGVCAAVFLETLLRISRGYLIGLAGAGYEHRIACQAITKLLEADLSKLPNYGVGEYLHRVGSVSKLKDFYSGYSLTVLFELALVPLFFGLIVYIGHVIAVVPIVVLTLFFSLSVLQGSRLCDALKRRENADDQRFNFLIESLEGIHTLKSFALEKIFERRYEALEEQSTIENYGVTQETSTAFNMGAIFSHIMVVSIISFGAFLVLKGQLTTGALIATLLLSGRMMQPVQKALALWTRYQDYILARDHLKKLFQTPQREVLEKTAPLSFEGSLTLSDISFQNKETKEFILKSVDLELKKGEVVLVSGEHGAGKTMLFNLIAGVYPPTTGQIIIDRNDVNSYRPEELTQHVGYIRTQPLIFRGTIRDNITCFGQVDEGKAKEISTFLGVDKDVAQLPSGFDTFLNGDNTDEISLGLRQRIAMVRVLATKPRIILFDSGDRALDKKGYTMIYQLMAQLKNKATMILISEDQNIRKLADTHYMLKNGRLSREVQNSNKSKNVQPYQELYL